MKKLVSILLCLQGLSVWAYDFSADGFCYTITSQELLTCELSCDTTDILPSEITFPSSATVEGVTYSVTSIADSAFANNPNLKVIHVPGTIRKIGKAAFYKCSQLTKSEMYHGVWEICESAFEECRLLEGIDLPSTLTSLGSNAFRNCVKATWLYFPLKESATVGDKAFYGCTGLWSVTVARTAPEITTNVFSSSTYKKAELCIPFGSYYYYKSAPVWNKFSKICESSEEDELERVTIHAEKDTLVVGEFILLSSSILPANVANATLLWSSSNTVVAEVDNDGKVTALAPGLVTITATTVTSPAITAKCNLVVIDPSSISSVSTDTAGEEIYDLRGNRQTSIQKGVNLIVRPDGSVKKVMQ